MSKKHTEAIAKKLNMNIKAIICRGNTDHRKDIFTEDGKQFALYKDGQIELVEPYVHRNK